MLFSISAHRPLASWLDGSAPSSHPSRVGRQTEGPFRLGQPSVPVMHVSSSSQINQKNSLQVSGRQILPRQQTSLLSSAAYMGSGSGMKNEKTIGVNHYLHLEPRSWQRCRSHSTD